MKNQLMKFIALCAIVCGSFATANAQDAAGTVKPAAMTPDQRTEMRLNMMKTKLNLTDAQLPKVKALLDAENTARASGDKDKMKASHENMKTEMGKILTPDQMTKYNEMQSGMKGRMHGNGSQPEMK